MTKYIAIGLFIPPKAKCTFLSNARRTFFKIDHMFGHKIYLYKSKKIEIVSTLFSDHEVL